MSFDPANVSAVTALVAVIVGPVVTFIVAKKQINASVVSGNRQVWINRLRDELAALIAIVNHLPAAHANGSINTDDAIQEYGRFLEKAQVVKLLINPKEDDHQELVNLVNSAGKGVIESISSKKASAKEFEDSAEGIVSHAQVVLKREWERVKIGE